MSLLMILSLPTTMWATENQSGIEAGETVAEPVILNDATGIPDKALYDAVLKTADKNKDEVLTVAEAEAVTYLGASELGIKDITGIGYLKNLTSVDLGVNEITDISALKDCTSLKSLYLADNAIADISVLVNMTKLEWVRLAGNQITDISPLKNCVDMIYLNLNENPITDISVLANMPKLGELLLFDTKITDITPLKNCTELSGLGIARTGVTDISVLAACTKMSSLNISGNGISDISVVANFPELWQFFASDNKISDISALANLTSGWLSEVYLDNNQISDISGLPTFEEEESGFVDLNLANNNIRNIDILEKYDYIHFLDLSNNNIRDISVLDKFAESDINTEGNPIGEKEVYTEEQFKDMLTENATTDVVIESNDAVTITFGKGTMKEVEGQTKYDFTSTVSSDYAAAQMPETVEKESFVAKISFAYSGNLPAEASMKILVGNNYAGKTLYYSLLTDDGKLTETQSAVVSADGYMTVKQSHCSDWVITTTNPNPVNTTQPDNNTTQPQSPNTGERSNVFVWMLLLVSGLLVVLSVNKKTNMSR